MNTKRILPILLTLVIVFMAACSSRTQTGTQAAQNGGANTATATTTESKLAAGTLKLEGTENAVTSEEAKVLLPLWKAVKSLSTSETTSEEEMSALYKQIQESMTSEQVSAIEGMEITQEDMASLMGQYGVIASMGQDSSGSTTSSQAQGGGDPGGMPSGGGAPGGMPSGGGAPGGMPSGGGDQAAMMGQAGMTQQGTQSANSAGMGGRGSGMSTMFVEPLIKLLEERANS